MKRGDRCLPLRARFVGERNGVVWLAYDASDYEAMCEAFDAVTSS